jgi:hypothetical protein
MTQGQGAAVTQNGSILLHTRVVAIRQQISCDLAGESVVLNLRAGVYYGLNEVAAHVWKLVQEPRTIEEIRDVLLTEYRDVSPETCTRDLMNLIQNLREWKLLELHNGKPDPRDR